VADRIGVSAPREHTFASGRVAVIRDITNIFEVFGNPVLAEHINDFESGAISDPQVAMAICREVARLSLVSPRLAGDGDEVSEEVIPFEALWQEEIDELVDMWQDRLERAARFRGERAGKSGGGGGGDVGAAPKSRARPRAGKP
jgi:hypothetical protein